MGKRTSYEQGTFSWADLATPDAAAAKEFYGKLFGWSFDDVPVGDDGVYTMASIDGATVGAISQADPPPRWNSYISVDDVDEMTSKAEEAGATIHAPAFDVMEAGRMSVIQDPSGGVVSLWQAKDTAGAELVNAHGALSWNDLMTYDVGEAAEFYAELLGWEVAEFGVEDDEDEDGGDESDDDDESEDDDDSDDDSEGDGVHVDADDATDAPGVEDVEDSSDDDDSDDDDDDDDEGEDPEPGSETTRGEDQRLLIKNGERFNGGMATIPRSAGETVPPHWLPYFGVESIEAALTDVRDGGGEVMAGPVDIPQGKIAVVADPQGAVFALYAGEFED